MSRPRSRRPGRRATGTHLRQISVFTEGKKTEPDYLNHWHRAHRDRVYVAIVPGVGVPTTIVDQAVEHKRHETKQAKSGQGRASDEYWCVFDVDEHPNIRDAVQKAQDNGINVAISNPCIELWFILHFQDQTAHIDRHSAQSVSKKLLKCGKILDNTALRELTARLSEARKRAQTLDCQHRSAGNASGSNPSSGMWKLIDQIMM